MADCPIFTFSPSRALRPTFATFCVYIYLRLYLLLFVVNEYTYNPHTHTHSACSVPAAPIMCIYETANIEYNTFNPQITWPRTLFTRLVVSHTHAHIFLWWMRSLNKNKYETHRSCSHSLAHCGRRLTHHSLVSEAGGQLRAHSATHNVCGVPYALLFVQ